MRDNEIRISIRNLIEHVLRSGDLDSRFIGTNRILEGTRSHQKVQRNSGEAYHAEVYLSFNIDYQGIPIVLEGRADGVILEDIGVVIDEIKSTARPLEHIEENYNMLHWAQVKCYAYIYAAQNGIQTIHAQLTYFQLDTEEKKSFRKTFEVDELQEFLYSLLEPYVRWVKVLRAWEAERDSSIKELKFPFPAYRKGQRELAVAVYRTITEEKKLFIQAPTGIGKTISTLFPAVKAIGEGLVSKIFYLTAKTITRQVAEEALCRMQEQGLAFKTITLTAKDKICFKKGAGCNPEGCEYAKGHFDRVNDAIVDIFSKENNLTREIVERYARKYNVCPFEFALDLSLWVDCIICDYNYVFDPRVYLKRFFLNNHGDYVFLIDEAHNLVDRAREMFSAELYKAPFLELKKLLKKKEPEIAKILTEINSYLIHLRKKADGQGFFVEQQELSDLYRLVKSFIKESEEWLSKNQGTDAYEAYLELYFHAMAFIRVSELFDERYITYVDVSGKDVKVKLFCMDPSYLLSEALKRGKTAVFFSATLTPLNYFRDILGGCEADYTIRLPSPFEHRHLCLLIANQVSTRYKNRQGSYDQIASLIQTVVCQKQGNYMVYFPSYKYMHEVWNRFTEQYPDISTLVQQASMTEEEREEFMDKFQPDTKKTLVGFGVLGGIFSEGVDLKGDRLIGAVIIGVGLPQVNPEQELIMNYFQARNGMGHEYAYMFPGMNKVLQAAGRVIRSEEDRGIVLLVDERFSQGGYKKLFPSHWNHGVFVKGPADLAHYLQDFWRHRSS